MGARKSKFDCREKLAPGEPYFILRAQDMLAPEHVESWAIEAELNGCPTAKVADARAIAKAMRAWRNCKLPDLYFVGVLLLLCLNNLGRRRFR
jgi:hypothetical protein